jgi:hypothetical protein
MDAPKSNLKDMALSIRDSLDQGGRVCGFILCTGRPFKHLDVPLRRVPAFPAPSSLRTAHAGIARTIGAAVYAAIPNFTPSPEGEGNRTLDMLSWDNCPYDIEFGGAERHISMNGRETVIECRSPAGIIRTASTFTELSSEDGRPLAKARIHHARGARMNRRKFLGLTGAGISLGLRTPAFAKLLQSREAVGQAAKPYGSGHFGEWITDRFGLPAYRYTCNQLTDPRAKTLTHEDFLAFNDHLHEVGNDRVVAVASNFGHVQLRQDEGAPKFLNDYTPEHNRYGGGIGYLTDGKVVLGTYYPGQGDSFERILGEGYLEKIVKGGGYTVDQTVFAPFGDDPVLISLVKIANHGKEEANLRWVEYWGASSYQFSDRALMEAGAMKDPKVTAAVFRRRFAERFEHHFEVAANGRGLLEKQRFTGRAAEEEALWAKVKAGAKVPDLAPGTSMDDLNPPNTFLVSLDGPMDGYATDGAAFFGSGGAQNPSGLHAKLANNASATGVESAHLMERNLTLQPGQTKTLAFLYGYLPEGFELDALVARYSADPAGALERSSAKWKTGGVRLTTPAEPWVEREISWHNYYLRAGMTHDSFFREPILSQGCVYQYVFGFQGAARDPLQHTLPFIFSDPAIVRGIIRYTLKEIQPDGSIPYGIVGCGVPLPSPFLPSDQEMWLLWALSEYVLATRDKAFLDEKIPLYPRQHAQAGDPTVGELAMRSFRHLVDVIGVGEHGLMRVLRGDWNDGIVESQVPAALKDEVAEKGESSLNSAMACYVLDHYGRLQSYVGDAKVAAEAKARAQAQRDALRAQWVGRWFSRAWLGPHLGWLGNDHLWLEPQPWAIIGGAATAEQSATLVEAIDELVRKPSPIGAMIQSQPTPTMTSPAGTLENGGVWASINGTLIWALAMQDGAMAWDEWKKNSLTRHAEAYPNIWYGIWSGPDFYRSVLSLHPGETQFQDPNSPDPKERSNWDIFWTDFPVMCLHQHAWPLYTTAKLLGLEFHERGLRLQPTLPMDEYDFSSALVGVRKSKSGYSGWYEPSVAGRWELEIQLPETERLRLRALRVNGVAQALTAGGGAIRIWGASQAGKPLRWEVTLG